jgi:hypothetical protein
MEPENTPKGRRGVAMMVVLGVVVFFTMLGFMGLEMATKDSQVSGTLLDIKSKESAAWGGLNMALGVMQANPSNTVTQLQKFIADSSQSTSSKRRWFSFSGGSFSLVSTQPSSPYALGTGGDQSGVWVRLVSMDINGISGITDGSGIDLTFESTGRGRNGQQLKILATYRMLGVDVPVTTSSTVSGTPEFAFYLNGGIANGNMGTDVKGSVFMNGTSSFNSVTQHVEGRLIVNGGLSLDDSLTVDSGAVIHGALSVQAKGARFKGNLILDELATNMGKWIVVDSSMLFRGTGGNYFNTGGTGLKVGLDFVALQADAFQIANGAELVVGRNAWMFGFSQQNATVFNVGGNLEIAGDPNNGFTIPAGSGTLVGGYVAARGLTSQNLQFTKPGSGSHAIGGKIYSSTGMEVNTTNFSSGSILLAGQSTTGGWFPTPLRGLVTSSGTTFDIAGDFRGYHQQNVSLDPKVAGNILINGSVGNGFSGWTITGAGHFFRYNNWGGPWGVSVTGGTTYARAFDTAFPSGNSFVGAYPTPPDAAADLHFTAGDIAATLATNPPDTMYVDGTHSPTVNAKVVNLTDALCDQASTAGYPVQHDNWTGTDFNNLYAYLSSQGKLLNGYMVIDVKSGPGTTFSALTPSATAFVGKSLWIIEKNINVNGAWPNSATSSAIQVVYVKGAGSIANWGFTGTVYGYFHIENTMSGNGQFSTAGATLYGAIGVRGTGSSWTPNSSNLTIASAPAVFADITQNLPGVFHPATSSGSSPVVVSTSTKTLTARSAAGSLQFVRVGEFR